MLMNTNLSDFKLPPRRNVHLGSARGRTTLRGPIMSVGLGVSWASKWPIQVSSLSKEAKLKSNTFTNCEARFVENTCIRLQAVSGSQQWQCSLTSPAVSCVLRMLLCDTFRGFRAISCLCYHRAFFCVFPCEECHVRFRLATCRHRP